MVLDQGALTGQPDILSRGDEIPLPETVQALIAARLDLLPPEQKSLLQDASVVGKVFWSGTVAFMSGISESRVLQLLHELARNELIRPARRSSMKDQAEYYFWHILVRDVTYSQIPRVLRGRRHRAAAEWIERMSGARLGDHAEILASHYAEAMELARADEGEVYIDELRDRAVRFLALAGDRLIELDVTRAGNYYRRALELLPESHAQRPVATDENCPLRRAWRQVRRGGNRLSDSAVRV